MLRSRTAAAYIVRHKAFTYYDWAYDALLHHEKRRDRGQTNVERRADRKWMEADVQQRLAKKLAEGLAIGELADKLERNPAHGHGLWSRDGLAGYGYWLDPADGSLGVQEPDFNLWDAENGAYREVPHGWDLVSEWERRGTPLTGSATYEGTAHGISARKVNGAGMFAYGHFAADATFVADFSDMDSTDFLTGTITNFRNAWRVPQEHQLNTDWHVNPAWRFSGNASDFSSTPYWDSAGPDGPASPPDGLVGSFDAVFPDDRAAGVYSAGNTTSGR